MKLNKIVITPTLLVVAAALSACGGGGDSTSTDNSRTKTSVGAITAKTNSSITVNGVSFDTSSATITSEDDADLDVGMVVSVEGEVDGDQGKADKVEYDAKVEGIVTSNETASGGDLVVMGMTIMMNEDTKFESELAGVSSVEDIAVGSIVEVSGFEVDATTILATRIEVEDESHEDGEDVEVEGIISNLDEEAGTFMIGELTIAYDEQTELEDKIVLADGLLVEVEGDSFDGDVFIADEIKMEDDAEHGMDGEEDEVEIQGVVTSELDGDQFGLNGMTVIITEQTEFEHGSIDDITLDSIIEVEGEFDADGNLIAEEIEFEEDEVEGMVTAVVVDGEFQIDGTVVVITDSTEFEHGTIDDIILGAMVEASGDFNDEGKLVADEVEFEEEEDVEEDMPMEGGANA